MSTTQFTSESRSQYRAKGYSAASATSPLAPTVISRRDPGNHDVQIEIFFVVFAILTSTRSVMSGA